jgi:phosphoserine aminotransferase
MKKHNFSAGPAILPDSVLEQAAQAARELNGSGLSLLEMSHRGKEFIAIMDEALSLTRELVGLDDRYEVMFLQGGASTQFFMVPMNLLAQEAKACYVDTGTWASKAFKEAKAFGNAELLASSKDKNYSYIPKGYDIPSDAAYLHLTSNNTIFGTEYFDYPKTEVPLVCDMSSDFLSRPIDASRFGLIYAGAQKNIGPAGVTVVIVRKDMLGKADRYLPTMLNYSTHINDGSMFNTPPTFPIYVCMLTMRWLKENGGLTAMQQRNEAKANILYDEIDSNPLFVGTAAKEDRSLMNVTFVMHQTELEAAFLTATKEAGCDGLKGHRSVGGFRASIYNAMPIESVQVLVDIMRDFAQKHA